MLDVTVNGSVEGWPPDLHSGRCRALAQRIDAESEIHRYWLDGVYDGPNPLRITVGHGVTVREGYYRIHAVIFFRNNEDQYAFYAHLPFHFELAPFWLSADGNFRDARTDATVGKLEKQWQARMTIGNDTADPEVAYRQLVFICRDALFSKPVRIGPAELYPLSRSGVVDLGSSIKEGLIELALPEAPLRMILDGIAHHSDRRSPMFAICFPRVRLPELHIVPALLPYVKRVFGILCLNRGSYAKLDGCIYIKKFADSRNIQCVPLNSYYRGNLVTGSIARENPLQWQRAYEKLESDPFATEVVNKLNAAHQETDLDMAYFRLWSLLETVALCVVGGKKLDAVEKIIRKAYSPQPVETLLRCEVGSERFDFNELMPMWLDWRDMSAHNGGLSAFFHGRRKVHPGIQRLVKALQQANRPVEYGEDPSMMVLRDATNAVIDAFVDGRL